MTAPGHVRKAAKWDKRHVRVRCGNCDRRWFDIYNTTYLEGRVNAIDLKPKMRLGQPPAKRVSVGPSERVWSMRCTCGYARRIGAAELLDTYQTLSESQRYVTVLL